MTAGSMTAGSITAGSMTEFSYGSTILPGAYLMWRRHHLGKNTCSIVIASPCGRGRGHGRVRVRVRGGRGACACACARG